MATCLALSLTTSPATAAPTPASASPAFYVPPTSLPAPGSVVRTQPSPLFLQIPGVANSFPGTGRRIMYTSTEVDGSRTAVTGTLINPSAAWTGRGARPTVVLAPGTIGQGDQCAPSKMFDFPVSVDLTKPTIGANYEFLFAYLLLTQGVRVMLTDYIGLGTPGIHTYVNRLEEGHAVLDGARAALAADKLPAGSPVGFWGYSQGGGASASAAELASGYAPELNVRGTYAGAPPADLSKVVSAIDGTSIAGAIGYAINGLVDRYPPLKTILGAETNATGRAALAATSTQCIGDSVLQFGFHRTNEWIRSGKSLSQVLAAHPEAQRVVDEQRIGTLKPNAPVLVDTGINDDVIPHGQVMQLVSDWRRQGANVTVITDRTPAIFPKLAVNHVLPDLFAALPALQFIRGQFDRS
ncbi:lipase family protein [Williamsia sterculiae]|nr:lipase family protein [Williamsia sterculiae]